MNLKLFNNLLLFSLFGIAMWFFGNLYEAIVIAPNMLENTIQKMHSWQSFFVVTNPVFFYIPIPLIASIILIFLYFKTPSQQTELKRKLKLTSMLLIISILLSVYIISQINLKLFFGNFEKDTGEIFFKALRWNILNIFRLVLVATALAFIFKGYVQTQKEQN